jgi:hypothetical protein
MQRPPHNTTVHGKLQLHFTSAKQPTILYCLKGPANRPPDVHRQVAPTVP